MNNYGHTARIVFQASRDDKSKRKIDHSIDRAIQVIHHVVESMAQFEEASYWTYLIFEMDPIDDSRLSFQVRFASTMLLKKLAGLPSNVIYDLHQLLERHDSMRLCAKSISECKPVPSTRSA
jgi:hypothetical protein